MKKRVLFFLEMVCSAALIGFAIYITGRNFYSASDSLLLNTTDAVPIYTKAKYLADCLREASWPLWFPNWYCGTSISQYYPPLTLVILTPLEFFLENTTLSLKIYIFSGLFLGSMGVWVLFYKYIGRFWGIVAAVLYAALPYFAVSFLFWGTVAQVPIIAVAPWYMMICIEYFQDPKARRWTLIVILTLILLLSHVMHGFMIVICVLVTMLLLCVLYKKKLANVMMWMVGTGIAAGLLGFWWVTGVLPLENPGVPSLAADAAKDVTANLSWFFPDYEQFIRNFFPDMNNAIGSYFPFSILLVSFLSIFLIRHETERRKYMLLFLYVQTAFSFVFSFGSYLPIYKYLPLANQLVPGRILTQAAIGSVLLTSYVAAKLLLITAGRMFHNKTFIFALLKRIVAFIFIILMVMYTWQSYRNYPAETVSEYSFETSLYGALDKETASFEKGRLAWFGEDFSSIHTYFSYMSRYNIVSGWNIEGTSTADYLRYQNAALAYAKQDYILKNIYDMNVQTCFVNNQQFQWLGVFLQNNGFEKIASLQATDIYQRDNYGYFMEQVRSNIVIGKASNLFLSDYPWFVKGYSANPFNYKREYFDHFDVVYFCDPEIDNMIQMRFFENLITDLAGEGKTVFVEFGRGSFSVPVLGVLPSSYTLNGFYMVEDSINAFYNEFFSSFGGGQITQLFGLDTVLYKLRRERSNFTINLVGTKDVGSNKVYFIGGPVTQSKSSALSYLAGNSINKATRQRDEILNGIHERLFDELNMYEQLKLPAFETKNLKWSTNGCTFHYHIEADKRILASLTYTPRWKVYIDNVEIKTSREDNMVVFSAPAGEHTVEMKYSMTIYGKVGWGITILSLILAVFTLIKYKKMMNTHVQIVKASIAYLQITD